MPRPSNKTELLEVIDREYAALQTEVAEIDPADLVKPGACEDWSVKDILAHLDAWHALFLEWERAGAAGESVDMPAPGFTWKETPELNDEIYRRHQHDDYATVIERLTASNARVRSVIDSYSNEDLFTKKRFEWTGSTSVGSYAVSATSSHYDWARKLIRKFKKNLAAS